jgi:hypothetical protein
MKKQLRVFLILAGFLFLAFIFAPNAVFAQITSPPTPTSARTPTPEVVIVAPEEPTRTPTIVFVAPPTPTASPTPVVFRIDNNPGGVPPAQPTRPVFAGFPTPTRTPPTILIPPIPDLYVTAMEVTQGMQDLQNRMPLVGGRQTVVRVYMGTDGGNLGGVRGLLVAYINGQQAGMPISSDNQPITVLEDGGERINLNDSLYFYIPSQWRQANTTVKFKVFVYQDTPQTPFKQEKNADNNFFEVTVKFGATTKENLRLVTMHNHAYSGEFDHIKGDTVDYWCFIQPANCARITNNMFRFFPLASLNVYENGYVVPHEMCRNIIGEDIICAGHGDHEVDWNLYPAVPHNKHINIGNQLQGLSLYKAQHKFKDSYHWYGMQDVSIPISSLTKDGDPISFGGIAGWGVAIGKMDAAVDNKSPWLNWGGLILAHEVIHNMGFSHYLCAGNEEDGGKIEFYPYLKPCSIAKIDPEGFYGFDVYYAMWPHLNAPTVISNDPEEETPHRAFPVMGYQAPFWTDAYTWCRLLTKMGVPCDLIQTLAYDNYPATNQDYAIHSGGEPGSFKPGEQAVFVAGMLKRSDLTAQLSQVYITDDAHAIQEQVGIHINDDVMTDEQFNIVLVDSNGNILVRRELNNYELGLHEPVIPDDIPFMELLPWRIGAVGMQVRAAETVLIDYPFSQTPPTIEILSPLGGESFEREIEVRWSAKDADGDALLFMIRYSPDGGENWEVLVPAVQGNAAFVEIHRGLPGSANGIIEVSALDGTYRTSALSGPISLPNQPPQVFIQAPAYESQHPTNANIHFVGTAYDPEDGQIPDSGLVWKSDIDGDLGVGADLMKRDLTPGEHAITLTVTDSNGISTTATAYIYVDANVVLDLPTADEITTGNDILNGILPEAASPSEGQPQPETPREQPEQDFPIWLIVGIMLGAGVIAFVFWRLRRK